MSPGGRSGRRWRGSWAGIASCGAVGAKLLSAKSRRSRRTSELVLVFEQVRPVLLAERDESACLAGVTWGRKPQSAGLAERFVEEAEGSSRSRMRRLSGSE